MNGMTSILNDSDLNLVSGGAGSVASIQTVIVGDWGRFTMTWSFGDKGSTPQTSAVFEPGKGFPK